MMTIVVNAEEKFGVRIPDDEVKNLKTVRDAVGFIASARPDPRSCPAPYTRGGSGHWTRRASPTGPSHKARQDTMTSSDASS